MRWGERLPNLHWRWRRGHALVAIPVVLIFLVVLADELGPKTVQLGPLLAVAPALTAAFAGPITTGLIGLLAIAAQLFIGRLRGGPTTLNHEVQFLALVAISAFVVLFCYLHRRRDAELARVRSVSEAAQRVVLRPLPRRSGPLRLASVYLAADAEARVGGDLYATSRTPHGTRLLIGDVRGKGLVSLSDAALLLCAFREAAHRHAEMTELIRSLEASVTRNLAELAELADDDDQAGETFVTAALIDVPDDQPVVRLINCGHPPPLLLRGGRVRTLQVEHPAPPLALGDLSGPTYRTETFDFKPGDLLILYTDGVIEARGRDRCFYPFVERVLAWRGGDPESLVEYIRDDLIAYVGGRVRDDAALIVVERET